jgi:hypothetical protein
MWVMLAPPRVLELVGLEGRPEETHFVFLKEGPNHFGVGRAVAAGRAKLLIELVTATGGIDHNDFGGLAGEIEEGVGYLGWQVGKAAFVNVVD